MRLVSDVEDDEFIGDTGSTLIVEHSFDQGVNPSFSKRGIININSITSGVAQFRQDGASVSDDDISKLKDAAASDGIYRLRIRSKSEETVHVSSFLKACSILETALTDIITVNVDNQGYPLGVSLRVTDPYCTGKHVNDMDLETFRTIVEVVQTSQGPTPDTQSYLEKIDRERKEKQKGAEGDTRSFFSKYWMYIVPVILFMLFANSMDPNAQGGGR